MVKRKTFNWYFILLFLVILPPAFSSAQNLDIFFQKTDIFLKNYVINGSVHYKKIHQSPDQLDDLIASIKQINLKETSLSTQKAFWINAYNLLVIYNVVEDYPMHSPLEVNGFFKNKKQIVAGIKITLEELENQYLRIPFKDPNIHFALVCGAVGCPPIIPNVYLPETLDQQLETQTRKALNDPQFIRVDETSQKVYLSEIFRWYAQDFKYTGKVLNYINQYRDQPVPESYSIRYYEYDWRLNDYTPSNKKTLIQPYRASTLLYQQQFELKIFSSLYTQRSFDGFNTLNSRSTYFSSFVQLLLGTNRNLNYGVDLVYKSNVLNDFSGSSPFNALLFRQNEAYQTFPCNDSQFNHGLGSNCFNEGPEHERDTLQNSAGEALKTRSSIGLGHIGPKIKFNPIKKWKDLTLQQTLYIPIQKKVDGSWVSFSQLFFDKPIGSQFQLFAEVGLWTTIHPNFRINDFYKIFFSYFPTKRWTIYAMTSLPAEYGMGAKFFITKNLEIELLYTHYLPIESVVGFNRPNTFNLGFRFSK